MLWKLLGSLCLVLLFVPAAVAADAPAASLEQDIARQAAEAIPADLRISTVGIGPIEGDGDGALAHALAGALARLNRFKVIERRDLDKLLQEQGVQARDWIDPKERVKFGKVKGVQGLVFGKVAGRSDGWLRATLAVQLKLDDVERGQVVMARELVATRWHYGALGGLAVVAVVVLVLVLMALGRTHGVKAKERLARADERARTINTQEVTKALGEIGRARSALYRKGLQQEAIRVKDLEVQLRSLKDRIALAPSGLGEGHTAGDLRQAAAFEQRYREFVENLTRSAGALCDHAGTGSQPQIEQSLRTITEQIREAEAAFHDRRL